MKNRILIEKALSIDSLAPRGDGVGRAADGGAVYVDRAAPGDVVTAKIARAPDGVLRGEILEILTPGPDRAAPPCPHYAVCGGCTLQHISRTAQQNWKETLVRTALARQEVTPARWHDPVFIPEATRRRATFAAFRQKDRVILGYHARRSRRIAEIERCLVLDPAIMDLRARMGAALAPILKDSRPADIMIQKVGAALDVVITGPVGRGGAPDLEVRETAAEMVQALGLARLSWRADARDTPEILLTLSPVVARFGALGVDLPPGAFLQPSAGGEAALAAAVMEALPETGKEESPCADLFAGCGTFAGRMAARGKVEAFESGAAAVEALARAGKGHGVRALRRDLFREPLSPRELARYAALVIDPPRAGAKAQMESIAQSAVPVVVHVSCNPATFARDTATLCEGGYAFESAQIIDQFAFSHHVEMVGVFSR